jgi:hypothetical protein
MNAWIAFLCGIWLGFLLGIFLVCLLKSASEPTSGEVGVDPRSEPPSRRHHGGERSNQMTAKKSIKTRKMTLLFKVQLFFRKILTAIKKTPIHK